MAGITKYNSNQFLRVLIDYMLQNERETFETYLNNKWCSNIVTLFWQAYDRLKNTNIQDVSCLEPGTGENSQEILEVNHVYLVMMVYVKEQNEEKFLTFFTSKFNSPFQENYWEIYYHLVNSIYDYHSPLFQQKTIQGIKCLQLYHILLVLVDYLQCDGNLDINSDPSESTFFIYLESNRKPGTMKSFLSTYANLKQNLFEYYSNPLILAC